MEHQLKLHSDSLQSRIEELEEENLELHNRIRTLSEVNCSHSFFFSLESKSHEDSRPERKERFRKRST